jgi:hypothetical protein
MPEMRDIRPDLKVRLDDKKAKRLRALAQAEGYEAEIAMLEKLIADEDTRLGPGLGRHRGNGHDTDAAPKPSVTLDDFIIKQATSGPKTKVEIGELAVAAGYFKPSEKPGRTIHARVVNLKRAEKLNELGDGRYEAA